MNVKNYFLLIISVLCLLSYNVQAQDQQFQVIPSKEVQKLLEKEKTITILDVRTPGEFKAGHLKGAVNINIASRDFATRIERLEKGNKTYLVYCRTKNRSSRALRYMLQKGFDNIYLMSDGFSGWSKNRLPIQK